jgi:hypothetical protein
MREKGTPTTGDCSEKNNQASNMIWCLKVLTERHLGLAREDTSSLFGIANVPAIRYIRNPTTARRGNVKCGTYQLSGRFLVKRT